MVNAILRQAQDDTDVLKYRGGDAGAGGFGGAPPPPPKKKKKKKKGSQRMNIAKHTSMNLSV